MARTQSKCWTQFHTLPPSLCLSVTPQPQPCTCIHPSSFLPLLTVIIKDQLIEVTSRGLHPDIVVHVISAVHSQADTVSQRLAMIRQPKEKCHTQHKLTVSETYVLQHKNSITINKQQKHH